MHAESAKAAQKRSHATRYSHFLIRIRAIRRAFSLQTERQASHTSRATEEHCLKSNTNQWLNYKKNCHSFNIFWIDTWLEALLQKITFSGWSKAALREVNQSKWIDAFPFFGASAALIMSWIYSWIQLLLPWIVSQEKNGLKMATRLNSETVQRQTPTIASVAIFKRCEYLQMAVIYNDYLEASSLILDDLKELIPNCSFLSLCGSAALISHARLNVQRWWIRFELCHYNILFSFSFCTEGDILMILGLWIKQKEISIQIMINLFMISNVVSYVLRAADTIHFLLIMLMMESVCAVI